MRKIWLGMILVLGIISLWSFTDTYATSGALPPCDEACQQVKIDQAKTNHETNCKASWDCIEKPSMMIDTSLFSVWWNGLKQGNAKDTINFVLGSVIQKLMIALWVLALLIMTYGAWLIIIHHGEDEYLSKGKNIFIAGITSLVIALSSYYLVNMIAYILYK